MKALKAQGAKPVHLKRIELGVMKLAPDLDISKLSSTSVSSVSEASDNPSQQRSEMEKHSSRVSENSTASAASPTTSSAAAGESLSATCESEGAAADDVDTITTQADLREMDYASLRRWVLSKGVR